MATETTLFIVRHGETEYNRLNRLQGRGVDKSLNETGTRQARALQSHFAGHAIDTVYTSSLVRSVETARIVCEDRSIPMHSYSELDEMNFGEIEGQPYESVRERLEEIHKHWQEGGTHRSLQGGESPEEVLQRAAGRIRAILESDPGDTLLFVLHGRLMRILISHWLLKGLHQMHTVLHQNAAINHLAWNGGQIYGVQLNITDHLKDFFPKKKD